MDDADEPALPAPDNEPAEAAEAPEDDGLPLRSWEALIADCEGALNFCLHREAYHHKSRLLLARLASGPAALRFAGPAE